MGTMDGIELPGISGPPMMGGVEQPAPAPDETIQDLESINLVFGLEQQDQTIYPSYFNFEDLKDGPETLVEIGETVVQEYQDDLTSRAQWEENVAAYVKLFTSFMEPKNTPWPNASNVCLPMLSIATLQFHARAYDALIPPKAVMRALPTGDEDIPRAERVGKYMNYQLLYKMPDFEEGMDKTLIQLPIVGDAFRKTVYDQDLDMVVSVPTQSDDVIVNYGATSLESALRVTHRMTMTPWDINRRINKKIYAEWARNLPSGTLEVKSKIKEVVDSQQGITDSTSGSSLRPRVIIEQHRDWDLEGTGVGQPYVMTVDLETRRVLRITKREYMDSVGELKRVDYFTHYFFFPNPEGFYGLGFGILIRHLNESANTIINEVIDAGTLANEQGGFILERSGLTTGVMNFNRGEYKSVRANVDDIKKAIFNFDFKGPNQTLYAVLGLLYEYTKLVSSVSETMTGQLPSSDTPASTVQALIEEGRKVFSAIHKRIHRSFKKELGKIYRLNSIYLNEREYFKVLGDNNAPQGPQQSIGKADFKETLDVIPVSDPAITSRAEKIMKAEKVMQDIRTNPLTAQNQQANFAATKRFYEAMEIPNIPELLQPPPPPPDLSPEQENANFFTEQPANVLPQQDHHWHLQMHQAFLEKDTLFSAKLTPEGKKLAGMHVQATIAALYTQQREQERQQVMGGGGSPSAPLPMGIPTGIGPSGMRGGPNG
jgi:chaperonin GroES